jgi:asparagine synthase (glutamine-hydrolysing)
VVRELIARHESSRIDGTDRILALMNLEIWARMYLDARSSQDVAAEL